ncbi:hypothetical protein JOD43_003271 [Pullulanibacillus pueri]|uniref:Uncharacterized protein n=1 Tax=Pullulanibacillus pueri TaxID=1437324 RepID=A0A8J2ZY01_9BACL|nr:hypothetical protein [Pullulanibacillus pueri]MBM7683092.1 hypothetical protein [Pullulanibacillus pueri]GGH85256.1 hypothetical protein GCM10007096_30220 [Pullulanibacillus pueri]
MLGALFTEEEICEIEYLVKKELEELSFEIDDSRINHMVRRAMEERYQILFKIFKRFASSEDCIKFMRQPSQKNINE